MAEWTKYTPVLSQVNVNGEDYYLKDKEAREKIDALSSATHFIGKTTSAMTDGHTGDVVIGGETITPQRGDIVYAENGGLSGEEVEFIFNGSKWQELGSTGNLKALAFKDEASTDYTPAGTVSQLSFTGTAGSVSVSGTPTGSISSAVHIGEGNGNYTPTGSVSKPDITVTSTATTGKYLVTDAGSIATYTLPELKTEVDGEILTISFNQGTFYGGALPTLDTNTQVLTGVRAELATNPEFTGQATDLTFTGTAFDSTGTFTPSGNVSQPSFTGTKATITVS